MSPDGRFVVAVGEGVATHAQLLEVGDDGTLTASGALGDRVQIAFGVKANWVRFVT